jgi:hypothetical protein
MEGERGEREGRGRREDRGRKTWRNTDNGLCGRAPAALHTCGPGFYPQHWEEREREKEREREREKEREREGERQRDTYREKIILD